MEKNKLKVPIEEARDILRKDVATILEIEESEILDYDNFFNDLGMDSMQFVELLQVIETKILNNIQISDEYLSDLVTLDRSIECIEKVAA